MEGRLIVAEKETENTMSELLEPTIEYENCGENINFVLVTN